LLTQQFLQWDVVGFIFAGCFGAGGGEEEDEEEEYDGGDGDEEDEMNVEGETFVQVD